VKRRLFLMAGALALIASQPAQAACVDGQTVSAARLNEFETMMMTVSLRCSRIGVNMRPTFDSMVEANRQRFEEASAKVQKFFSTGTAKAHGGAFDLYSTRIANKYGAGGTTPDTCRMFDALGKELSRLVQGGQILATVAEAMIRKPVIQDPTCP